MNVKPSFAVSGNERFDLVPNFSQQSTKACDETNPLVNVTFNWPGYVSRRSSMHGFLGLTLAEPVLLIHEDWRHAVGELAVQVGVARETHPPELLNW